LFAEDRGNWHVTCPIEVSEGNESYPGALKGVAMKRGKIARRIVFTFLKLMVGIIIVGILAAIAIPLYTGHVERKRVTEATSIMGAIITSQKVERGRTGKYYMASTVAEFKKKGIDITDTKYFTYETATTPNGGFKVTATPTDAFGTGREPLTYIKEPGRMGRWGPDPPWPYPYPMPHIEPYRREAPLWVTEGKPMGSITAIEGEVYLSHKGDTVAFPAILGDPIYLYDFIQTEKQSRVQILLKDESFLNLAENTYIQINEHIYSPEENRRSVVIRLLMGRVRGIMGRYFTGPGSRYIISTPTDTIAVEHGHFVVDATAGRIQ
jgi:Tfp pilus assembly protein PilE